MVDRVRQISEKTVVPITFMAVIVAGSFWLQSVYSEAKAAHDEASECTRDFKKIDERLSRIEGKLEVITNDQ